MSNLIKIIGILSISLVVVLSAIFIYVSSFDYQFIKSFIEKTVGDVTGRKLSINGDIYFHIGMEPGIRMSEITFQNASWSSRPNMIHAGQLTLDIRLWPLLKKKIDIKRFILEDLDISIEINEKGESNFDVNTSPPKQSLPVDSTDPFDIPQMGFQNLCLKKVNLFYQSASSVSPITLTFQQINASAEGMNKPVSLDLSGVYHKHPINAKATFGSITQMLDSKKKWPIKFSANAGGMHCDVHGYIQDVFSFKGISFGILSKGDQLKTFQEMIGTSIPVNGPYSIQINVSEKKEFHYSIAADMFLGDNKMKALSELYLNRQEPGIKLVLEADSIDLRPFIVTTKSSEHQQSSVYKNNFFSKKYILPSPLASFEIISKIRIHSLITQRLAIHNINTVVHLTPDFFNIKQFSSSIGGGTISGKFLLDNRQQKGQISANMATEHMNIGKMLKELDITEIFEGSPDMAISLNTSGESMHEWMARLNGHLIIQMGEGKIYNQYINMLGGEISSNFLKLMNPMKTKNYALIHCLASRFDIHDGIADITIFMMDSDQMRVLGTGNVHLGEETLDISLNPLPKSGLDTGRLGKYSLSLSQLAQPFKLGGTLSQPRLKLDLSKAAWSFGKAVGGLMLFGPAGIAVSFISGVADEGNPCHVAHEIARTGKYPDHPHAQKKSFIDKTQESVQKGMNEMGKSINDTWKFIMGQ